MRSSEFLRRRPDWCACPRTTIASTPPCAPPARPCWLAASVCPGRCTPSSSSRAVPPPGHWASWPISVCTRSTRFVRFWGSKCARSTPPSARIFYGGEADDLSVLALNLEHGVIATTSVGRAPTTGHPNGYGGDRRLRLMGSHGTLVLDAARPALDGARQRAHRAALLRRASRCARWSTISSSRARAAVRPSSGRATRAPRSK